MSIQWYPGHIAKYERQLKEYLKLVDVVVEVLDARIPMATVNSRLEKTIRTKPVLVVLNKSDLGDPVQNKRWLSRIESEGDESMLRAILYESKTAKGKTALVESILKAAEPAMKRLEARGRKRRPARVLIAGMPNVGKSSLINNLVNRKKTKTGHLAGVTRSIQWVRIHPAIELLDSPGIIPPLLDSDETGYLLAAASSIGEAAFEDEALAKFLLEQIQMLYPGILAKHYNLSEDQALALESIAENRHYKREGGHPDTLRAAQAIITDFRQSRLGRISLQHASPKESRHSEETED